MAINVNEYLEDFKHLNPKDPGTWPLLPKLVALLAILALIPVGGYFLDWQEQLAALEAGVARTAAWFSGLES